MRLRPLIAVVLAALIVAGCSSDESSEPTSAPTTTSPPSTEESSTTETTAPTTAPTTPSTVEATVTSEPSSTPVDEPIEVLIAGRVRAYFDAREQANAGPAPDPNNPSLPDVAAGEALASTIAETQRRLDDGRAIRAGDQALAEIFVGAAQVDGSTAQVAVCSIDDGVIYTVATDAVVNDDVVTHNYLVDLEQADDVWKVVRIVRLQQWEGVAGCALAPGDFPY